MWALDWPIWTLDPPVTILTSLSVTSAVENVIPPVTVWPPSMVKQIEQAPEPHEPKPLASDVHIFPSPDPVGKRHDVEIDCVVLPNALSLSSPNTTDVINDPYTAPVQFYAAYLAKYYEQSYGEAEIYKQEYNKHAQSVLNTVFTRRVPSVYSSPY